VTSNPLSPAELTRVEQAIKGLRDQPGPLLNVLHAVHEACGYIPPAAVPIIANGLNLSRAEVHGVISFYHYFRDTPPGRHIIRLCRAESCQAVQAKALEAHASKRLGIGIHETTADGAFSLEPVYCLGQCALSPAVMIGGEVYGRVTPDRFDALVLEWGAK
jgi:formate dehydrogenase subunit gamma